MGKKCGWQEVWASGKVHEQILAEPLHVCLHICVQYYVEGWGSDRLNAQTLRSPGAASQCLITPSPSFTSLAPSAYPFALLFSPPPFHSVATKTQIKLASHLSISYYSPETRLIHPLNWASGRQSLSPRQHQSKQQPLQQGHGGDWSSSRVSGTGRSSSGVWGQNCSYRMEGNLQRLSLSPFRQHTHTDTLTAALPRILLPGVLCFSQWIHHLPLPPLSLINITFPNPLISL